MKGNNSNGQMTAQVSIQDQKKSGFDLSHNTLGTGRIGRIIPTRAQKVLPSDKIVIDSKAALQFEPLAVPILANMYVKQEHFYVPYNVVWQDWDKFISGGEKMDYHGQPPTRSLRSIIECVNSEFSTANDGSDYNPFMFALRSFNGVTIDGFADVQDILVIDNMNPTASQGSVVDRYRRNQVNWQKECINSLNIVGDKYGIRDILKPMYYLVNNIANILPHSNSLLVAGTSPVYNWYAWLLVKGGTTDKEINKVILREYYDKIGITGNKYMESLFDFMLEVYTNHGGLYLPSPNCISYIRFQYDLFKDFYGIGSNLDYLSYNKLSFRDFVLCYIMELNRSYFSTNDPYPHDTYTSMLISPSYYVNDEPMNMFNLRANYCVWYNNYRDVLLETKPLEPDNTNVVGYTELFTLLIPRQRCWEKDSFTTALDNPGTGNVGVPMSVQVNVAGNYPNQDLYEVTKNNDLSIIQVLDDNMDNVAEVSFGGNKWRIPTAYLSGNNPIVPSSLGPVHGFSLYALDAAQRAQKWLQKALYFGNRITDFYYMHFGVRYLDARLHLPELLTSSSKLVSLDVVMNNTNITTEVQGEVFQSVAGDRAAYASAYDEGNSHERFIEEHGVVLSYLTVMPQQSYAYGYKRDYSRLDQFDYAFPEFATLGMDAVYQTEICSCGLAISRLHSEVGMESTPMVFGYQGKYYDYKANHTEEHGELLDSQDMYTFSRAFDLLYPDKSPVLSYEFVHCFPDLDMFVVNNPLDDFFRYDIRHSTALESILPLHSIYI